jgi:hypothetical protein
MARANAGSTIVTQPVGSQTAPTIVQRALIAIRKISFTSKELTDPERLYQVISQQEQAFASALQALGSSPISVGTLLIGTVFTAAQTLFLSHQLGRPWTGYICTQAQTNPALITTASLPTGATPDKLIALHSVNAGTYDFWIFSLLLFLLLRSTSGA